jgi:lysophospholipase L1-like esterase
VRVCKKFCCLRFLENYNHGMNHPALWSLVGFLFAAVLPRAAGAETPHNFSKWEHEIAAFEAHDRTNPPPTNALLFIGSSTIRFWTNLPADFPGQKIINRGFGGSEIADSTHFADRIVFPYAPRAIFLRAGGNDINAGKSSEAVFADFKEFVATVRTKQADTEIFFISCTHTPARWQNRHREKTMNELIEGYVRQTPHLQYIETGPLALGTNGLPREELFRDDKLHFNAAGYKLLAESVRPFLPK